VLFRTSSYADFAQSMVPGGNGKVRGFDQIWFGLSVAGSFRKDVVMTAKNSSLFSSRFSDVG
jgi:hypothetical protein